MIPISNDFKTAMKKPIKEIDAYLQVDEDRISSSNDLIQFKISCDSSMCKTAMRKLEAKFLGEHNLLNKWIHPCFGVRLENGTFEYLDYGSFLVTETTTSKDTETTTIVAYDKMISSMIKYEPLDVEYPISLYDYANEICSACGLELGNDTFVNSNWQIDRELYENIEGITYRDILVQIAEATASTCIISDDKVCFKYLTDTEEELTYDNMIKLKLEPIYGEINSVVLGRDPIVGEDVFLKDDESISEYGLTEFRIVNNEIVDKNREDAITPIYNSLKGISFYPFETTTEGLGWYEIGDTFTIINDLGEEFKTSLFNFNITVDGGIKETLKTNAESKTQSQYQFASTISKRIKNTEITVNKQDGVITAIASEQEAQSSKMSELEMNNQEISSTVSSLSVATNNNYQEILDKFNGYMPVTDFSELENSVRQLQTDTYTKTEIQQIARGIGVDGTVVEAVISEIGTFDDNGLTIEKSNAKTKGNFNEKGMTITDATGSIDSELLFAGYDETLDETIVRTKNINVEKYLTIGKYSRIEDFIDDDGNEGTGIFFIGGVY